MICESWLKNKSRKARAKVTLGLFDGIQVYTWEGITVGEIPETPRGSNGFGWDDIFIPDGSKKTFTEMTPNQKDKYSMRQKALKQFAESNIDFNHTIFMLPEPYTHELERVQIDKLAADTKALKFAYKLECLEDSNKLNKNFEAPNYSPLNKTSNSFFTRFTQKEDTASLGLILTDVDRAHLKLSHNGEPVLWQMGPERRHLALAQRAEYFIKNQDPKVHSILDELENKKDLFPKRNNRRSITIEDALGIKGFSSVTRAISLKEIGYKKLSSQKKVSRTYSSEYGLFNIIGKYPRSIYGIGCLPYVSGWRDLIVMSALGHMPVFVHRNHLNAVDFKNQINLIKSAKQVITDLKLSSKAQNRAMRNIGAAIGADPIKDLEKAKVLFNENGIKLFRIYTINSDPRVIETAANIREYFGDDVEIFVGQVVDKTQCKRLVKDDIKVDGLIFGHGGGRQCTSATNGMALSTLEEIYEALIDRRFNNTSILVEGGIGTSVGALLVMGIDCILRNGQFANCVIEQGDVYYEHKSGRICQPYHGSASAATMIIESLNKENAYSKLNFSGRTKNVEGESGYIFYQEKANSMSFYVDQFKHYAARTLADLGVKTLWELREKLDRNNNELLRIVSAEATRMSGAWKS